MKLFYLLFLILLMSCSSANENSLQNLNSIRKDFIEIILSESYIDEAPLHMSYNLRTIFFSDYIVSLFGEVFVYAHLPHGWTRYETKTYIKQGTLFKEITINDLFPSANQKELLRVYCEDYFKHKDYQCNYFNDTDPLHDPLLPDYLKLFVVDHESIRIIFQPYTVGGCGDEPFTVKIPFNEARKMWQPGNPVEKLLPITNNFVSSWDSQNRVSDIADDHSIGY